MDTPNLPENEPEEITWQDDENRATLFLRSVFVLLSGALIFGILVDPTGISPLREFHTIALLLILPTFIIWFFFGQGLRPVEWLTDQKYNAWNYGVSFTHWKTHFCWMIPLLLVGIGESIIFKLILLPVSHPADPNHWFDLTQWLVMTLPVWILGICVVWFFWGYLWFGCAQGFGAIAATALVIGFASYVFIQSIKSGDIPSYLLACFLPLVLLCSYICWKLKSWIPILYGVVLLAPIVTLIFMC